MRRKQNETAALFPVKVYLFTIIPDLGIFSRMFLLYNVLVLGRYIKWLKCEKESYYCNKFLLCNSETPIHVFGGHLILTLAAVLT